MENVKLKIFFEEAKKFELQNIKPLSGIIGLYFIFLTKTQIAYPFNTSKLIYIGMSEKRTNSIGSRLMGHFDGQSGNIGLTNYRKVEQLNFTYLNFEMLKSIWQYRIEDLESYFILDFVKQYGVYPICNNKTGFEILELNLAVNLEINWNYFKE
jgi:hypothetical protein